jgi:hypothetical protein
MELHNGKVPFDIEKAQGAVMGCFALRLHILGIIF